MRCLLLFLLWMLELGSLLFFLSWLGQTCLVVGYVFSAISYGVVLHLIQSSEEPAFKIGWLCVLLPFPGVGGCVYLLIRGRSREWRRGLDTMQQRMEEQLSPFVLEEINRSLPYWEDAKPQIQYLEKQISCPAYGGCQVIYLPKGEELYQAMLMELEQAQDYIFLEYFLIDQGEFWQKILDVLIKKVAQGVEVRLIYDDAGCLSTLDGQYPKELEGYGIQVGVFHPLYPLLSARLNHRNHRKMLIIDGTVAFTGGVNLADEYINRKQRFGYWKDSGILLRGLAVWSMTVFFLTMWEYCGGKKENDSQYFPKNPVFFQETSVVLPYNGIPMEGEAVGQRVFLNLIARSKQFIHITSPYLILDTATQTALCLAAKSGVEVVIITPHIPDKKLVFQVTRAFYEPLLQAGVLIYEFTPGFIHEKNVVVDGVFGTIGTVNLDFRSLFLHFENGLWLWNSPCLAEMERDFQHSLSQSCAYKPTGKKRLFGVVRSILRLFSPFM